MNIYYIRHLSTEWNNKSLLQGMRDIEISESNTSDIKQIDDNKKKLDNVNFDFVLTSELIRTHQTAEAYGFVDFEVEPLINEFNFKQYEGQPKELMLTENKDSWFNNVYELQFGENIYSFEKRLKEFIEKYKNCTSILVFGHGMVGRAIKALTESGEIGQMNNCHIQNNSINIFKI